MLIELKGQSSVINLRKIMVNYTNIACVVLMCKQNMVKFYPFVLKILSRS